MVVAPVVILTIGAFVTVIIGLTGDVLASRASNAALFNIQDGLNRMEQDIKLSSGFLATNNITPQTGQGFDNGTAGFKNVDTTNGTMLILNSIATTGNPIQTGTNYVYAIDPLNACNSAQVIQNTPQSMNIIYFVKAGTLWRRVVMQQNYANTATNWCAVPWQLPSCTPGYVASFCKTQDIQIVSGLGTSGFNVQYYSGANNGLQNTTASDTSASDTNRAAALVPSTTATISLTTNQTVAGRTVAQSGTIRATRLDINASSIYTPPTPTIPAAPVVTASVTSPTTAVFTWPVVPGATSYTLDYKINSGSWVNAANSGNPQATTFSISTLQNNLVSVRTSAHNSAGTSTATSTSAASITIPLWATPLLQNNWSNYGGPFATVGYTKLSSGLVVLKGLVKSGSGVIFTLPVGYRPAANLLLQNSSNSAAGRLDIGSSGSVGLAVGNNAWFSLDGVAFMPSGTTFTLLSPFSNGWNNYSPASGDTSWMQAQYYQDATQNGRFEIEGLVYAGTITDGTPIVAMPTALEPQYYEHVSNDAANTGSLIAINGTANSSTSTIYAKGGPNNYTGIHAFSFPGTYASGSCPTATSGWCALTLANSWIWYGSPFSTPRYTKTSDGLVLLKGLLRAGTTTGGTVMASMPYGYCPNQELLLAAAANGAWARIDISAGTASGCNVLAEGNSAAWTSLDATEYLNEQY